MKNMQVILRKKNGINFQVVVAGEDIPVDVCIGQPTVMDALQWAFDTSGNDLNSITADKMLLIDFKVQEAKDGPKS